MERIGTQFVCGLCGAKYDRKEDALSCESSHHGGPISIRSVHYRTPDQGAHQYPDRIELIMADGTVRLYISSD